MKYLLLLWATVAYTATLEGFVCPITPDDTEACYGAEKVIVASQAAFYRPVRQKCLVKAPAEGKIRTYEVIACAKLATRGTVCDGFSGIDTASTGQMCIAGAKPETVCRGFNVQVMDGAYVGVTNRDDLTEAYTASQKKQ